jgi:hypothetical protein
MSMREVIYVDRRGFARRMLIRDHDTDDQAEYGVPAGIHDVEHELDWESIIQQINNILVYDDVKTLYDLQRVNGINKIGSVVGRAVYQMYREKQRDDNGHNNK